MKEHWVYEAQRSLSQTPPLNGSRWRHYGGGIYKVAMKAVESNHPHRVKVIYESESEGYVWEHPLEEWNMEVEVDGILVKRFTPLEDENDSK
jgi:hypothetical protein